MNLEFIVIQPILCVIQPILNYDFTDTSS